VYRVTSFLEIKLGKRQSEIFSFSTIGSIPPLLASRGGILPIVALERRSDVLSCAFERFHAACGGKGSAEGRQPLCTPHLSNKHFINSYLMMYPSPSSQQIYSEKCAIN